MRNIGARSIRTLPTKFKKNIGIKRNAEDFLMRLKPISVALDRVQSDTCVISETVEIWKDPEKTFKENDQPISTLKHVKYGYNQVMTDSHFYVLRKQIRSWNISRSDGQHSKL